MGLSEKCSLAEYSFEAPCSPLLGETSQDHSTSAESLGLVQTPRFPPTNLTDAGCFPGLLLPTFLSPFASPTFQ